MNRGEQRREMSLRIAAGALAVAMTLATTRSAFADVTPTADATHLTPPESPPLEPSTVVAPAPDASHPVEVLPGSQPVKLAAYIFGGVAVVGLGIGSTFGILSLKSQHDYNTSPNATSLASANQDAVVADVALGAAVIAGVTGIVLFLKQDDRAPSDGSVKIVSSFVMTPFVAPHTAGAGALLRF